ncbi:hypothetical protein SOV_34020 [Sporomusa ovata DSM 2662]|uniref:Uncharacterized protein n=1 Tax=Sporomusa ovata TaxID=2378 RepID=A0A0U1L2I9_9FIRM|nr:hypothetical protein [Sporomusa ovata]EQB25337.1 hypothetical protein SOV_5c05050 [Sporomusa ovata DSM 2662]CQR73901.1 hypothetical protein SpAn4DRAFT_0363 [Sporomusa ovata]
MRFRNSQISPLKNTDSQKVRQLFLRNSGAIASGRIDSLYPFFFLAWLGSGFNSQKRYDPDREGLFTIGNSYGSGVAIKNGIILPIELCTDKAVKEKLILLISFLNQNKETKDIQSLREQIHQKLDIEGMQWLRLETGSDISGFVGLEPTRDLFAALQKNFPMVTEIIDQPGYDVQINHAKSMPWFSRGDLMEWMASMVEMNIWRDVKVHPFLVFANADNWKPNFTAEWKSPAIEIWTSRSADLLAPNPSAHISTLTAKFTVEEYGWANLNLYIDNTKYDIRLSSVFPPFWDILTWIKMVERGQLPVSVTIDEEGTEKVLSAERLYNSELLLFRLAEKYEVGYLAETLISRSVLVKAFYQAFCDLLDTGFNPDEWSDTNGDFGNKIYLNMADDEWFHRN